MTGKENHSYPAPLVLNGKQLPWVRHATHLGHELSEFCNMELDARIKRARFIENSTSIREQFSFADSTANTSSYQYLGLAPVWLQLVGPVWQQSRHGMALLGPGGEAGMASATEHSPLHGGQSAQCRVHEPEEEDSSSVFRILPKSFDVCKH